MSKNKVVNSKMFFTHLFNHILLVLNTHCILLCVSFEFCVRFLWK